MFLSAIISACPAEQNLAETVESFLNQSLYGLCEIIILKGEAHGLDACGEGRGNIRLLAGFDLNLAIRQAQGEYLTFLDPGDRLRSDAVELFYRAAQNNPPQVILADLNLVTAEGYPAIPGGVVRRSPLKNAASGSGFRLTMGALYERTFLQARTVSALPLSEEFWEPLGGARILQLHEALYYRLRRPRLHPEIPPQLTFEDFPTLSAAAEGAVVFIAEVDYHLRHLLPIARTLTESGQKCVVFDISSSRVFPKERAFRASEVAKWRDLPIFSFDIGEIFPFFPTARAYVFTCDWGPVRPLLFQLKQRRVPTINFYEGIHDDELLNPPLLPTVRDRPYRNADWLLLPGRYYESIYGPYKKKIVGLPDLYGRLEEKPVFPAQPRALINVNFSYGVLEDKRGQFLESAIKACAKCVSYVLSQHPVDRARLSGQVSSLSVYEEIRNSSLLISRFSTCILEALAMGKPAIYHNPHGEKVPKFQENPMGAFPVTDSVETLERAIQDTLRDIEAGVDFRQRSAEFLQFHTNIFAEHPPELCAARAIMEIITADEADYGRRLAAGKHAPPQFLPTADPAEALLVHVGKAYLRAPKWKKALVLLTIDWPWLKRLLAAFFSKG